MLKKMRSFVGNRAKNTAELGKRLVGTEEIKTTWGWVDRLWQGAGEKKDGKKGREETFAMAYARLGLNEERLEQSYFYFISRFYICYAMLVIAALFICYALVNQNFTTAIACFGFVAVMGAMCFQASLRALQIRTRHLLSAKAWAQQPAEWFPPFKLPPNPDSPQNGNSSKSIARK